MAILCILTLVNFALSDNFSLPHHLFFYIIMNIRKDTGQGIEACLVLGKNWPLTCVQTLASYLFMRMLSLLLYSSSHGIWTFVVAIQVFSANDFVTNNTCESYPAVLLSVGLSCNRFVEALLCAFRILFSWWIRYHDIFYLWKLLTIERFGKGFLAIFQKSSFLMGLELN